MHYVTLGNGVLTIDTNKKYISEKTLCDSFVAVLMTHNDTHTHTELCGTRAYLFSTASTSLSLLSVQQSEKATSQEVLDLDLDLDSKT